MKNGIYVEARIGCTGPIILVDDDNNVMLGEKEYIAVERTN